ncbi:hypothetical protein EWM64_g7232 [Hericium alpestre]|uniref:Uncharacterized protein n=1 Tax=Hericium alpestre TaxID=135208 RepID=A0A4Y9ZTG0_9AGAM|nr:hypothetical protein EWM64_g7232 [Hericium alpestre]
MLLDLPHHHCNQIYIPWLSTGCRRMHTMQYQITCRFTCIAQSFMLSDPAPVPSSVQHNVPVPLPLSPPCPMPMLLSLMCLSIDTHVRTPRKHARFFGSPAHNAPLPGQFESPMQYDSPVGLYECDGWSELGERRGEYDDRMLCEFLEKHTMGAPSYCKVMLHLRTAQGHAPAACVEHAGKKEKNPCTANGKMRSFQTPELRSLVKLDMEVLFCLGLQDEACTG